MSKDLKFIETSKLTVYLELLGKMVQEIENVGMTINNCHKYGGITKDKKIELLEELFKAITPIDKKQHEILAELGKRLKDDFGMAMSPAQLFNYLEKMLKENPSLSMTESEFKMREAEKASEKKLIKVDKQQGPIEQAIKEHPEIAKKLGIKSDKAPVSGKIWKSAKTGEFVSRQYAQSHPDECYKHKVD